MLRSILLTQVNGLVSQDIFSANCGPIETKKND